MRQAVLLVALLLATFTAIAAEPYVPEELRPWIDWVLHPHPERSCPTALEPDGNRDCVWTRSADIDVAADRLSFTLTTSLFTEADVPLPGDSQLWPQEVRADGVPMVVGRSAGRPVVRLTPGEHTVTGTIRWQARPEGILLPSAAGLISLVVDGRAITRPSVNNGVLWFGEQLTEAEPRERDIVELDVYRLLVDDNPLGMQTHLDLAVGGGARTETFGRVLLPGFELVHLESELPARLDEQGNLKVQVEAGEYSLVVSARALEQPTALSMDAVTDNWPAQEIWAFADRRNLRLVELAGAGGVDLNQTGAPFSGNLRGFLINPSTTLTIQTRQRGDPDPVPNEFEVSRDLWLNFDGSGLVVRDELAASITHASRLSARYPLGRINVDGENLLVTTIATGEPGIELQTGDYELESVSALPSREGLTAVGWDIDASSLAATLHTPPGWRLLWTQGVDSAPTAWIAKWTLWDVFLLTLALLLTWRFLSRGFAIMTALTLIIAYQEAPGLGAAWLAIAALIAAQRAITQQRLQQLLRSSTILLLLGTSLAAIDFAIDHARQSLHPQLEITSAPAPRAYPASAPVVARDMARIEPRLLESGIEEVIVTGSRRREIPAGLQVQTGPGLPQWQWNADRLRWFGPVSASQEISLALLPPAAVRLLNALMAMLALLVTAGFAYAQFGASSTWHVPAWLKLVLPCLLVVGMMPTEKVHGHGIDPAILKALEERLLEPPECLPACAQIERASIAVNADQLTVTLHVHAGARATVPLPSRLDGWIPQRVESAGAPALLSRAADGQLQMALETGVHEVVMTGSLGELNRVDLTFPLNPGLVDINAGTSWQPQGWINGRLPSGSLSLDRVVRASQETETLQQPPAPAFVRLHRSIQFALEWRAFSRVERIAPTRGAMTVRIPLLNGESVLDESLPIEAGNVVVVFDASDSVISWESTIPQAEGFQLVAGDLAQRTEVWELLPDNLWHVSHAGIVPSKAPDRPGPVFHPYSGETLTITAERTQPVSGPTVTVESVALDLAPGQRTQTADLSLVLRASEGGNYPLQMPAGAVITQVSVDGVVQPIPLSDGAVALPVLPGETRYQVSWRNEIEGGLLFASPQVDLASPVNNATLSVNFPRSRWVLLLGGPDLGPAVLFWGVLIVVAVLGIAFSRIPTIPLSTLDAILLATGLTLCNLPTTLLVAAWMTLLLFRERWVERTQRRFAKNAIQLLTAALSIASVLALVFSVPLALLGSPDMQITGYGSNDYLYRWFQDHTGTSLPGAWVFSLPMWIYRGAMLVWSLWLAFALLRWVRWAWQRWSSPTAWYSRLAV